MATCLQQQQQQVSAQKKCPSSRITTILFDMDNTLIPTRKGDNKVCNKLAEILRDKYAVPSDVTSLITSNFLRSFRKCVQHPNMDLDTWRHMLWAQALGEYRDFADDIYRKWLQLRFIHLAPMPEVKIMLRRLREHYMLGLITNGPSESQWEKINRLDIAQYFDVTLVSGDYPWEKPHPRIFHEACQYLGVEPIECIMVGDKHETDILGGVQAKLAATVMVPLHPDQVTDDLVPPPDFVVKDVLEVPTLLPNNPKVPAFRHKFYSKRVPDLFDCNSNSSDGS